MQVLNEVDETYETYEFLDLQCAVDFVAGVVGWVPLTDPSATPQWSADLRNEFTGYRRPINPETFDSRSD